MRRDFWPGKSDLDFIVIGKDGKVPWDIKSDLSAFESDLAAAVDSWETSENELNSIRTFRHNSEEIRECRIVQLDINGFDVVDHHLIVWGEQDPLKGFPVPRGRDLERVAARRLKDLRSEIPGYGPDEINRIACDALKAASILFMLRSGRQPTRRKDELLELFFVVVPPFDGKDTAHAIWRLYRDGVKNGDPAHRRACVTFIDALVDQATQRRL